MGRQVVKSCLLVPIVGWKSDSVDHSRYLFFLSWWPLHSSMKWWALSSMGCMVLQPFAAGAIRSYLEFWAITVTYGTRVLDPDSSP
jgi:hypothetical protein